MKYERSSSQYGVFDCTEGCGSGAGRKAYWLAHCKMLLHAVGYHVLGHTQSFPGTVNGSVGTGTQPGETLQHVPCFTFVIKPLS